MYLLFKKWWFPIAMFGGGYIMYGLFGQANSNTLQTLWGPQRSSSLISESFPLELTVLAPTIHRIIDLHESTVWQPKDQHIVGKFSEHFVGKFSGKLPGSTTKLHDNLAHDSTWIPTKLQTIATTWRSLLGDIFLGNLEGITHMIRQMSLLKMYIQCFSPLLA